MTARELIPFLERIGRPRVAVLGDFMLDRYLWGRADRVSPEAPVPVVHAEREEERSGGAGNVVENLAALGAAPLAFGVVGDDHAGSALTRRLDEAGAAVAGLVVEAGRPTTQKIRVMARAQQLLRVDREDAAALDPTVAGELLAALAAAEWDALVVSDYGKGVLSDEVLRGALDEAERRGVPAVADPKHPRLERYRGAALVTPNRVEAEVAIGEPCPDLAVLAERADALRERVGLPALLVTLGAEGMLLLRAGEAALHLPTAARQVYDVTGAGDTVVATLAAALAAGLPAPEAVRLANVAAGLAVAKVGTTPVGRDEVLHALHGGDADRKVMAAGDDPRLAAALEGFRREGLRIVFTNGCFDLLHAGHVRYLQEARAMGDVLVVGLNDDDSVRRLKGADRPFNPLADRADVLAGLACVDLVVPFSEDTPEDLVRRVEPDVLVKGADWEGKGVAGAEFVRRRGGEVRFVDLLPGRSTTDLAGRIRER